MPGSILPSRALSHSHPVPINPLGSRSEWFFSISCITSGVNSNAAIHRHGRWLDHIWTEYSITQATGRARHVTQTRPIRLFRNFQCLGTERSSWKGRFGVDYRKSMSRTKLTEGSRVKRGKERGREEGREGRKKGGKKGERKWGVEREIWRRFQVTVTEASSALGLSSYLSQYIILKKKKKQSRHNELLSTVICPHCVPILEYVPGFLV